MLFHLMFFFHFGFLSRGGLQRRVSAGALRPGNGEAPGGRGGRQAVPGRYRVFGRHEMLGIEGLERLEMLVDETFLDSK